jgi:hypothetical protein
MIELQNQRIASHVAPLNPQPKGSVSHSKVLTSDQPLKAYKLATKQLLKIYTAQNLEARLNDRTQKSNNYAQPANQG